MEYIAGSNLFALPSLSMPYGAPGTLKSLLLAEFGICAAAGIDCLPPASWITGNLAKAITMRKSRVMWLDFDNGVRRTHDRIAALARARDLPPDLPFIYYSMPSPWLDATDKGSIGELALRIKDNGSEFVIIDNLGVISGGADENSAEMIQVMSIFQAACRGNRCSDRADPPPKKRKRSRRSGG